MLEVIRGVYLLSVGWGRRSKLAAPHDLVVLGVLCLVAGAFTLAGRVGRGPEVLETGLLRVVVQALDLFVAVLAVGRGRGQEGGEKQRDSREEMHGEGGGGEP